MTKQQELVSIQRNIQINARERLRLEARQRVVEAEIKAEKEAKVVRYTELSIGQRFRFADWTMSNASDERRMKTGHDTYAHWTGFALEHNHFDRPFRQMVIPQDAQGNDL